MPTGLWFHLISLFFFTGSCFHLSGANKLIVKIDSALQKKIKNLLRGSHVSQVIDRLSRTNQIKPYDFINRGKKNICKFEVNGPAS